jgi:hypothetical protein
MNPEWYAMGAIGILAQKNQPVLMWFRSFGQHSGFGIREFGNVGFLCLELHRVSACSAVVNFRRAILRSFKILDSFFEASKKHRKFLNALQIRNNPSSDGIKNVHKTSFIGFVGSPVVVTATVGHFFRTLTTW